MFTLKIETDNDAFRPSADYEVARILRLLAYEIEANRFHQETMGKSQTIHDRNGNDVGRAKLEP